MDRDWLIGAIACAEVLTLQHASYGMLSSELDQVRRGHRSKPGRVERHLRFVRVQDFEDLISIGPCVRLDLPWRKRRTCRVLPGRVTDHRGEVSDQEDDVVAEDLKLPHLIEQNGVAQMQVRRSGVESCLDTKRSSLAQLIDQLCFYEQFGCASLDLGEGKAE